MLTKKKYKEHSTFVGARAPLFNHLIDHFPDQEEDFYPTGILDFEGLKSSVIQEIELILNTRPTAKRPAYDNPKDGISDYGFPIFFGLNDFSWFDSSQTFSLHQIGQQMEETIRHFEPRILYPQVTVINLNKGLKGLDISIGGKLMWNNITVPFSFPLTITNLFSR